MLKSYHIKFNQICLSVLNLHIYTKFKIHAQIYQPKFYYTGSHFIEIVTCKNGGTLVIDVGSPSCRCTDFFGGNYCETGDNSKET